MVELTRRRLLGGLAALVTKGRATGGVAGWLSSVGAAGTLSPQAAQMLAWQYLLLNGDAHHLRNLNDSELSKSIIAAIPEHIRHFAGFPGIGFFDAELQLDLLELGEHAEENRLPFNVLGTRMPMPANAPELVKMVEQYLARKPDIMNMMKLTDRAIMQDPDSVLAAIEQIHKTFPSLLPSYPASFGEAYPLTRFETPQALEEYYEFMARSVDSSEGARSILARTVGLQHVDPSKLDPVELQEIRREQMNPEWRSAFGEKADEKRLAELVEPVLVITTGGTIESFYDPLKGTPSQMPLPDLPEETEIPRALSERLGYDEVYYAHIGEPMHRHLPLLMRDSNEFTDADCEKLYATIINSPERRILVVHGTDTMPDHAQELERRIAKLPADHPAHGKAIVFTGGMGPLRNAEKEWRNEARAWEVLDMAMQDLHDPERGVSAGVWLEMGQGPWRPKDVAKFKETELVDGQKMVKNSGFTYEGRVVTLPNEMRGR